ncbi:MAG: protein phosphatase CheZ [Rhodospirillales bacterium]|nr:protein phosphatase CheZ [Rhodospirillales bacterium]
MSSGTVPRPNGHSAALGRKLAPANAVDRGEIAEIVQSVVISLKGDITAADLSIYQELAGLAQFIRAAKNEIAALRPDEIREKHLPNATDELDAIVGATEEATNIILDSVERIEGVANTLDAENKQKLGDNVTRIYEACNFQDITGQRITKVVKTLKQIETKVSALVNAFGDEATRGKAAAATAAAAAAPAKPADADLLNGPQLPANASSQADIDALFNKT